MTEEYHPRRSPFPSLMMVVLLMGGGWYFLNNYQISGLDGISVRPKTGTSGFQFDADQYDLVSHVGSETTEIALSPEAEDPFLVTPARAIGAGNSPATESPRRFRNLRIASWALDGFDTAKLRSEVAGPHIVRAIRQFDLVAIQRVAGQPRDLVPRLVDAINEGDSRYDYVVGEPTGPNQATQRMAVVFDTSRVLVDRSQTYTVADPTNQMKFDPLVVWFRAAAPQPEIAWTFSLVNVSIDLARAPQEVALLPHLLSSVRLDGRGEDDVVLAGQFQADDAYLLPTLGGSDVQAAVRNIPTDVLRKHQTSNILVDANVTSEFIGRGGTFDFLRVFNLSADEAEKVSSQLPVYAEFSATEDGNL